MGCEEEEQLGEGREGAELDGVAGAGVFGGSVVGKKKFS